MADFRKFLPHKRGAQSADVGSLPTSTRADARTPARQGMKTFDELREQFRQQGQAEALQKRQQPPPGPAHFAFVIDGTGSMAPFIAETKDSIGEIIRRVQERARQAIAIQFFIYRDYCDGRTGILDVSALSDEYQYLSGWLHGIQAYGGGDAPEAIEYALQHVFLQGDFCAVLLAGDAPSHTAYDISAQSWEPMPTAQELARSFGARGIPIHTFVVQQSPATVQDFRAIAEAAGGVTGFLDRHRDDMLDMAVMAILERLTGRTAVEAYMTERRLLGPASDFGKALVRVSARQGKK